MLKNLNFFAPLRCVNRHINTVLRTSYKVHYVCRILSHTQIVDISHRTCTPVSAFFQFVLAALN